MRRKLEIVLVILVVLIILIIIGRPLLRKASMSLFVKAITPDVVFSIDTAPPAPDYADPSAWAVTPPAPAKAALAPPGVTTIVGDAADTDVFYVHPTTYFGTGNWNAAIDDPKALEVLEEMVLSYQASVFNGSSRIFAPRYRQATLYAFIRPDDNSRRALELAYGDVERAFRFYLEHHNNGRPLILASHSQGTTHSIRLLEEMVAGSPVQRRMVAAYLIGYWLPEDKLSSSLSAIPICREPDDTGCIIAWDTFGIDGGPNHESDHAEHWYPSDDGAGEWRRRAGKRAVCVNPLTGRADTKPAPAELNLGAVHPVMGGVRPGLNMFMGEDPIGMNTTGLSEPLPHHVSAQCREDGFLYISPPTAKEFRTAVMPGSNYHNYDYGLFYMNIRADVKRRIKAFLSKGSNAEGE